MFYEYFLSCREIQFAVIFFCCCICSGFFSQMLLWSVSQEQGVGKFATAAFHPGSRAADFVL